MSLNSLVRLQSRRVSRTALGCRVLLRLLFFCCFLVAAHSYAHGFKVLVFSKTAGFRHDSITNGIATIRTLGTNNDFLVDASEDSTAFTDANLAQYQAVIFLSTTGDFLDNNQQSAFQRYIQAGGGFVGIHAAADAEYNWAWYGGLLGAYFSNHPPGTAQATIKVADQVDPSTSMLPKRWVRTDEWYSFQTNPRASVHVLATLDETTYAGGTQGFDHPIAWSHNYDGGRAWYTALGHTPESFAEPLFQAHLLGGIEYAAGDKPADPGSTLDSNFQKVILDNNVSDPMQLTVAGDGRVLYIERAGNVKIYNPANSSITLAGHIDVETQVEDGLLGITLDNGFSTNNWIYLFYSPTGTNSEQHISRFTLTNNSIDLASEKILLRIPTQRLECCHSAGSLFMHTNGDLYISVGDNSNPFDSSGYDPIDERAGRSAWDSQKSSSNANDLRGKILRIHPLSDGTYSIPSGNLFPPGTPNTKQEIYVMGCRNPFRISVDEVTGWLYWGEVGPDANADSASRGPKGHDEYNQARSAGNYGWPYFVGNNKAYVDYDFATGISGATFNPAAPVNNSPNNTGPTSLPPAQSAWLWYPYDNSVEFPELNGSGGRTAIGGPVYHYKTNVVKGTKLPAYYDNTVFLAEWSRNFIKEVKLDDSGNLLKINPFLPSFVFSRPIDLKIGPDGVMYLIEWGSGFNGSNPDARLARIDYIGGNHAPVAVAHATPDNGPAPLSVQFSSAGTYDPENDALSLAWSFFGNGVTNATGPSAAFTYTNAGNYQAQLIINDTHGNQTVANMPISVGNSRPVVTILQPPNGAIFDWGKTMAYQISAFDLEDGNSTNGSIACSNLVAAPLLGHNDHAHGQGIFTGCSGVFTAPLNTDSDADNLFFVLNASYTDKGGPNVAPLIGTASYVFPPRHKQAEFCTTNSGVSTSQTADPAGGGLDVTGISHGSFIGLWPVNLTNINGIMYRVACGGLGGRIETHVDAPNGPLLHTAFVPFTGGAYTNITAPLSDPGGTHTLYFVFLRNPGDSNLFVVNWLEFQGPGLALSPTPFGGSARALPGTVQAEDFDNGGEGVAYHDLDPANNGGQYRSTGVDLETTSDTGAGFDVTSTGAGEWLNYTVNANPAGLYTLSARVASPASGASFHIEFNGTDKTGPISIPNTGGPQTWQTVSVTNVLLDSGLQSMRLVMDTNAVGGTAGKFNYLQAILTLSNSPPSVALTAPQDQADFSEPANITLSANASDPGGSIRKVDFFVNGQLTATDSNAPYSAVWSNVPAGNYVVVARAMDNIGSTTSSASRSITVINGETPFPGFPLTVPGTIQAEDFDNGGEGVAYHDSDTANNGGQYRATAVDLESCSDTGGGYNVGWTAGGEWLNYTVNAVVDGLYTLQVRAASSGTGGVFHIEFDGLDKTGPMTNTDSGGWQTWRMLTQTNVGLTAGVHVMRLVADSSGPNGTIGNLNYFTLTANVTSPPPVLVHRYSFEGGAGATLVADSVGNANGTVIGGASFTGDGRLNLGGANGYVNFPNGLISGLTNVTLETWATWNGGPAWQRIFDFGNNSNGENNQGTGLTYLMLTPQSGSGVLRFTITTNSGGGEVAIVGASPLPIGQSCHIAAAYNFVARTAVLFLNGQRVGTSPVSIPLNALSDINAWLGRSQWNDPYFNGTFDEFRIYSGMLSDNAVAASFALGPNALITPVPSLSVTISGNNALLGWPLGAVGFSLEATTNLRPAVLWSPVTNPIVIQNSQHTVTIPISNSSRFFRLRQ